MNFVKSEGYAREVCIAVENGEGTNFEMDKGMFSYRVHVDLGKTIVCMIFQMIFRFNFFISCNLSVFESKRFVCENSSETI